MRLFVLAGGFGTRLKSVVSDVPKALAPVSDVPFLEIQIEYWFKQGIRNFTFLLHHQADQLIEFLECQTGKYAGECEFEWVVEDIPLDTGGAVANAIRQSSYNGDFLVVNADTWLSGGITEITSVGAPSMAVVRLDNTERYGSVVFNDDLKITSFLEKSNTRGEGWVSTGLCKLNSRLFQQWGGDKFSIETDLYTRLARRGEFSAVTLRCDFIDIGIPDDYVKFCRWFREGRIGELQPR